MLQNKNSLAYQLFGGWSKFEILYIPSLLWLQVIAFIIAPDTRIGVISGICGVLAVVLGMKGRKLTFFFGLIQCAAMAWIAFSENAYGYFLMSLVYLISMPIGWLLWGKSNDETVRHLAAKGMLFLFGFAIIAWFVCGFVLNYVGGELPYMDSLNLVIPLIAQTLYVLKYRENWILWIVVNVVAVSYWVALTMQNYLSAEPFGASLSQVALNGALLFNSLYALWVWNRYSKNHK